MRMRKKKHTAERMDACGDVAVTEPEALRGKWRSFFSERATFPDTAPLELEIGCGKGAFILESAKRRPGTMFIALEFCREAIMLAMEKIKAEEIRNVVFLNENAMDLEKFFEDGEIDTIYLNFSDPWPKSRHAKRRLTAPGFLDIYRKILNEDGCIRQKTDNLPLFEFSLQSYREKGFRLENEIRDLHASPEAKDNILTEYEINFSNKGFKINSVIAYPR